MGFESKVDQFNEDCSIQYLMDNMEHDLNHSLKPAEIYEQKLSELEMGSFDTIDKFNCMNIYRLQLNEIDILKKNLNYLTKLRKNI